MAGHLIERRQRAAVQDLSREGQPSRRTGRQASCDKHGASEIPIFFFFCLKTQILSLAKTAVSAGFTLLTAEKMSAERSSGQCLTFQGK